MSILLHNSHKTLAKLTYTSAIRTTDLRTMPSSRLQHISALLLGVLAVFGFAPFYLFPLSLFAVTGILYLWNTAESPKAASLLGFSFGLGLYVAGIYWIYIALHTFGEMPWWFAGFCTFCLCAFMALFPALVGYFSKRLGFMLLSAPVLWGISDWVRSWIFTGFPWLTLGYSQVPHSPLVGYMPLIGVYGVSVITAGLAALIAAWLASPQSSVWKRNTIAIFTLVLVIGFLLKALEWTSPAGKPISASLVQGNISQEIKWSPDIAQQTIDQYLQMALNSKAQLIVLPETALPVIASQLDPSVTQTLTQHAKQNNGGMIVGMVEFNDKDSAYFNSALSYGNTNPQTYRKNHLVPFGEYIPLRSVFGWIYSDWLHMPLSDLSRGGALQAPMQLAGQSIAVNICYEDVFGEEIAHNTPNSTIMVNISNDAWYGQSIAASQHMQFSQARAIENGRYMLRATNTGATATIDQHGYVSAHAPHDTKTILNVTVQGFTGSTPYMRWGNWPFIIFSFGVIAFVISRKKQ